MELQTISEESRLTVEIFRERVKELSNEITALTTIKDVLVSFVIRLTENTEVKMNPRLLADESLLRIIGSLPGTKINFKEAITMNDVNVADNHLSELKDVRIVYLPPSSVASIHLIGGSPEFDTGNELRKFMNETNLATLKPDLRHYGFNHPNGIEPDGTDHGYERWVTIPDDMEIPEPFVKKKFPGGLYAAHMIPMGNFEEWGWLDQWVESSNEYEAKWGDPECMHGALEEHLNYINLYHLSNDEMDKCVQLDLLLPIKSKSKE